MNWYICKGRGRLVVEENEPHPNAYIQGPFSNHEDAFERLKEMMVKRHAKEEAVGTWLWLVMFGGLAWLVLWGASQWQIY